MIALDALNAMTQAERTAALSGVFEHADWVAAGAQGPFQTVAALHGAMMAVVRAAPPDAQRRFLCGHPELGVGTLGLTAESAAEQAGLGALGAEITELNAAYRARHGVPFIVCVRRHTAADVLRVLHARLANDPAAEHEAALAEVGLITRLRLLDRVAGPGRPEMAGRLSTHVLDTSAGRAAPGVEVELWCEGRRVAGAPTNGDGRLDQPLLPPGPVRMGRYELRFAIGAYWAAQGVRSFYGTVAVAFTVDDAEGHFHVPLVASPWSYSTYRGS